MVDEKIVKLYLSLGRELIPIRKFDKDCPKLINGSCPAKIYKKCKRACNKAPIHNNWTKRQYTDEEIYQYAAKGHNLGWRLGTADFVVDIDPKNGGRESFKNFLDDRLGTIFLKLLGQYPAVRTGSGGYHVYMRLPYALRTREVLKEYPGVEFKTCGRQVVIPGSVHPITGDEYRFIPLALRKEKPKLLPLKILPLLRYEANGKMPPSGSAILSKKQLKKILKTLPVDEYREQTDWFALMASAHQATSGDGLEEFVNWSTSDPLYADHGHTIRQRWRSLKTDKDVLLTSNTLIQQFQKHSPDDYKKYVQNKARKAFQEVTPKNKKKTIKSKGNDIPQIIADYILKTRYDEGKYLINATDQRFWSFDKTHWKPVLENILMQTIQDSMDEYRNKNPQTVFQTAPNIANVQKILKATTATDFDLFRLETGLPSVINALNKEIWIDSDTGELDTRDHDYKSYLISCLKTDYNPNAECPLFIQTLEEIFEQEEEVDELIEFIFELFGYMLQPNKNIPIWVLLYGNGANGKTLCLDILSELGGESVLQENIKNLDTTKNTHVFADLPGKLIVLDDDVKAKTLISDDILKKISENKALWANPKFSPRFQFRSHASIIMASNDWPQTSDLSDGIKRRAIVIPFRRQFQRSEMDLNRSKRIIDTEMSGVLNECLRGLQRLRQRGNFELPDACVKAVSHWVYESNPLSAFFHDTFEKVKTYGLPNKRLKHAKLSVNEIWMCYQDFVISNSLRNPMSKPSLMRALRQLGYKIERSTGGKNFVFGIKKRQKE